MQIERSLVWLVGLVAVVASIAVAAVPIERLPSDVVVAALAAVVVLPLLFVFGRLLLALRSDSRGWS